MPPVIQSFEDIISGPLAEFISLSQTIGGDVTELAKLVQNCFNEQRALIYETVKSGKPSDSLLADKLKPLVNSLESVIKFKDEHRGSKQINHLSTVSESIPALGWVTMTPKPTQYIKEMADAAQFYSNRVLKEFKGIDDSHVDWVKRWSAVLASLEKYVREHHFSGMTWSGSGVPTAGAVPPPPPPPPPFESSEGDTNTNTNSSRAALFSELNKGQAVTSGLRKVTDDMKTHKNPNLRGSSTVTVSGSATGKSEPPPVAAKPKVRPPVLELRGNKWCVENFSGKSDIIVEPQELKESVYIYNCNDCCIQVKGKLNSIVLDSCKKTGVVFDSVISCVDMINCRSVQAQVKTKVASINIDKCDGVQLYINEESKDVEVVYAKSSEMNMLLPGPDGDFVEYPIPEQFKCKFDGTSIHSEPNKSC